MSELRPQVDVADAPTTTPTDAKKLSDAPHQRASVNDAGETISVCMIVRDASASWDSQLWRTLESVRPHVDELCILDTGSADNTLARLRGYASRSDTPVVVGEFEWRHDFAAARNASFALASSDWLMWLDSDDLVRGGEHLRDVLRLCGGVDYVSAYYALALPGDAFDCTLPMRLARRQANPRWFGVVHEILADPDEVHHAVVNPRLLKVFHLRNEGWMKSARRNLDILLRAEEAGVDDDGRGRAYWKLLLGEQHAMLGELHADVGEFERAVEPLREAVRLDSEGGQIRVRALQGLAGVYRALGSPGMAGVAAADAEDGFAAVRWGLASPEFYGYVDEEFFRDGAPTPVVTTLSWRERAERQGFAL